MPLKLMYITNNPDIALVAEKYGVDRIWIDLETMGKQERQKHIDSVKSQHAIKDIETVSKVLTKAELMVRVNPWNSNSEKELEDVIRAGAQRIMLPMWKTFEEVDRFLKTVNKRVPTILLAETKEAVECFDEVLSHPLVDDIHIGLNDMHLSYKLTFMFELLTNGTVDMLCKKCSQKNIKYGFGGIACIGEGMVPAEKILMEHYRLGSTAVILSRSFCNTQLISDINEIEKIFSENMKKLRAYETSIENMGEEEFGNNRSALKDAVDMVVALIREKTND